MTLLEQYKKQMMEKPRPVEVIAHVPELSKLIELLYMQMKQEKQQNEEQPMVEILGQPYIQTRSWYNPGQGIKQSSAVE